MTNTLKEMAMWTARRAWLGLVVLAAGCGASRTATSGPAPSQESAAQADSASLAAVKVEIDNRNFSDMSIYLISDGTPVRIGTAPGLSKTTLTLPAGARRANWRVRLLADPLGSSATIRTPTLLVAPGQSVYWSIGPDNASSYASAG